jgi:hypothetical protein
MTEPTVNVETEVPLTEAFQDETPVNIDESIDIEAVGPKVVSVDPNGSFWWGHEFQLQNSPWRVSNVSAGANNDVVVEFKREE